MQRQLFWRYKSNAQRALGDGDWKYLQVNGNDVERGDAADPEESWRYRISPKVQADRPGA